MNRPRYSSIDLGRHHPDFKASSWVQNVLARDDMEIIPEVSPDPDNTSIMNPLFDSTLSHETGLRARLLFRRPTSEPDSVVKHETCQFMSVGEGIDGRSGRGHGGFTSLVLDHLTGTVAKVENPAADGEPPATVTITVDYKAPVRTPCIILLRSWPIEISGRKAWMKGVVEGEDGKPYATAKALFINLKAPYQPAKL
ncbi:hypothetical protein AC579_3806 [Pseudocercospora musae]|uniref:Thioesterase domain-containing protein n=1 Tax=Pseudocercospora musae TaxID=113226 RepID=A0A139HZZ7_9PEZI|nr:hypothetical protein AC579_3806 [Pseudocercospora musae]